MRMRLLTFTAIGLALASVANAAVTVTPNVKDGDTISGEFTFKVGVESESLVTSVEFYVAGDLRDTDDSTPYEFTVDTLNEQQGTLEVTFAAYNQKGESAKKTLKVKIDNGLDKGAAFHIEQGMDALRNSKWDDATNSARIALKIDPNNNSARVLMARANLGKGVLDLAEKYAEDAAAAQPDDLDVMNLLTAVNLSKAFNTYSRGGDKAEAVAAIKSAMVKAAETRRKILTASIDSFGAVTDANRLAYCDLLIQAGRYSSVISELDGLFRKDMKNNDVANRLIYAEIRSGRLKQAAQALENAKKYGAQDGYGFGLRACFNAYLGDTSAALEAEKEAILNDPTGLGVKTAQAYLALRRSDTKTAANVLTALSNSQGHDPVVNTSVSALAFMVGDYDLSRDRFQTALLAEPACYDMLVERANQAIWFSMRTDLADDADYAKRQRALAGAFLDAALAARPESFEALTGMSTLALLDGRKEDAVRFGKAATAAGPEYAAAQWAYCAALFDSSRNDEAKVAAKKAALLDPKGLEGLPYPTAQTAWQYFYVKGRVPYLLAPGK